jgi:hypothetical protein
MQIRTYKSEKYLLLFTLLDILIGPYTFFLATTYSQFIIFFWFLYKDKRYFQKKEVSFYYGILAFILLSVIISLVVLPSHMLAKYAIENLKRGLAIGMAISYYFFFYYMFKTYKIDLEKWLLTFVLFVTLWGILYYFNIGIFLTLKVLFNPFDATLSNLVNENFLYRFNYIWTDPNNVGYALVGVVAFLILSKNTRNIVLIICVLCLLFNLLIIMSAGSFISAVLIIPLAIFIRIKNSGTVKNFIMILLSLFVIFYFINEYSSLLTNSEVGQESISRLDEKNETGDKRPDIWKELLQSKNIILYTFAGEGVSLFVNGKHYSPHSGHFVFIFGFGLICYYFYMYLIFRKSKKQLWTDLIYILPFFLCFTINIGIGELKFAAMLYMLVAYSRIKKNIKLAITE